MSPRPKRKPLRRATADEMADAMTLGDLLARLTHDPKMGREFPEPVVVICDNAERTIESVTFRPRAKITKRMAQSVAVLYIADLAA